MSERVESANKCGKCGFQNPVGAKFCLDCGKSLAISALSPSAGFDGLSLLHFTGSVYILVSLAFNELYRVSPVFLGLFLAVAIMGLGVAYGFYVWSKVTRRKLVQAVSAVTIVLGFGSTFILFYLGLGYSGVVGPAWVIFVVTGWKLGADRKRLKNT
jgi:hypothetical protein